MALNGEQELFQGSVKRLLQECVRKAQLPSVFQVDYRAYLLSPSQDKSGHGGAVPAATLLSVMSELLKEAFTSCLSQMKSADHTSPGMKSSDRNSPMVVLHSPWSCLVGIHGDDSPLPPFISSLYTLCCHTSLNAHIAMEIMKVLKADHTPILTGLAEVWCAYMKGLAEQCLKLWSTCDLHGLLVRLALCLLVKEVVDVVEIDAAGDVGSQANGGVQSDTIGGVALQAGEGVALQEWRCAVALGPILDSVLQGSAPLYQYYCQYEEEEKEGKRRKKITQDTGRGVETLQSVQFLNNSVQVMSSIAEWSGHQKLEHLSAEYALRLATQSVNHMQQLCEQVGRQRSVQWLYLVLASLDDLHSVLLQLHVPQDMEAGHAELCMREQELVQQVAMAMQDYHTGLCLTSLLQDAASSNWTTTCPFYEEELMERTLCVVPQGKRCSWTIQMWAYHMRALCYDLCTCLPERQGRVLECVLTGVLSSCLSHLVARYCSISPHPPHLPHFLADVILILSCVNSLLPWLDGGAVKATPSLPLQSIHRSCELLFAVAVVVASSLQQLLQAVTHLLRRETPKEGTAIETGRWQHWIKKQLHLLTSGGECVTPSPHLRKVLASSGCLSSFSEWGVLLQALLADGAAFCMDLCSGGSQSRVSWSEGSCDVLQVLSLCPHVQWALAAVVSSIQHRPHHCRDNSLEHPGGGSRTDPVAAVLRRTLGPILMSYLLEKSAATLGNLSDADEEWAWSEELLEGLEDVLHKEVCRPVLALLHCMASAGRGAGEEQRIGGAVAKILADILIWFTDALVPHPFHSSSSARTKHLGHVFQLLCLALDPTTKPPSSGSSHLPESTVQQVCQAHFTIWEAGRAELGQLVDMSPTSRPLTLLEEELEDCTLEEHCLAAQLIRSNEEGLASLQNVCGNLREHCGILQVMAFNPIEEYCNVGVAGSCCPVSQDQLTSSGDHLQKPDTILSCLQWLLTNEGPCLDVLIRKWRWEWQEQPCSQDVSPEDQELASELISRLKTLTQ